MFVICQAIVAPPGIITTFNATRHELVILALELKGKLMECKRLRYMGYWFWEIMAFYSVDRRWLILK